MKTSSYTYDTVSEQDPWPGLLAYGESCQNFFFGRDEAIDALFLYVKGQTATLLFGRSGLGKSSLLAAGLFPLLRPLDYFPVRVRMDFADGAISARSQLTRAILSECDSLKLEKVSADPGLSVWAWLRLRETEFWTADHRLLRPVLVFDQFEELFTHGTSSEAAQKIAAEFLDEIESLTLDRPPADFLAALETDPAMTQRFDVNRNICKVILALREDFLAQFEAVAVRMPPLIHNRMRLGPMNGRAAFEVITKAGRELIDEEVAWTIVDAVSSSSTAKGTGSGIPSRKDLERRELSPALLSLMCRELNGLRKKLKLPRITLKLVEDSRHEILSTFYDQCLQDSPPSVRTFIEDELVTPSGFRHRAPKGEMLQATGISESHLERLVNSRLLSYDDSATVSWVELTHDLLTRVVIESRTKRTQQTALDDLKVREKKALAEVQRRRAQAQKWRLVTAFFIVCTVLAFFFMLSAVWSLDRANSLATEQKKLIHDLIDGAGKVTALSSKDNSGVPKRTSLNLLDTANGMFLELTNDNLDDKTKTAVAHVQAQLFLSRAVVLVRSNDTEESKDLDQALAEVENARHLAPPDDLELMTRVETQDGDIYLAKGKLARERRGPADEVKQVLENAIAHYESAASLTKDNPKENIPVLLKEGDAYRALQDRDKAGQIYETARGLAQKYVDTDRDAGNDLLAQAYLKLGNIAIDKFNAGEDDPRSSGASQDFDTAMANWQQALKIRQTISQTPDNETDGKYGLALINANLAGGLFYKYLKTHDVAFLKQEIDYLIERDRLSEALYREDPTNSYFADFYATGLASYARALLESKEPKDLASARELAGQAVLLARNGLPFDLYTYGLVVQAQGDPEEVDSVNKQLVQLQKTFNFSFSLNPPGFSQK